jgi:Na+-translocating ferredoxin:NAD+ oxidoreductase RnfG subunit
MKKGSYCVITELQFDELLQSSKGWVKEVNGKEYVYGYRTTKNPNVVVYVYSTITNDGLGRKCGGDAIRVCAVNTTTQKGIIKSSRIYRTPGWDDRTKAKVLDVIKQIF